MLTTTMVTMLNIGTESWSQLITSPWVYCGTPPRARRFGNFDHVSLTSCDVMLCTAVPAMRAQPCVAHVGAFFTLTTGQRVHSMAALTPKQLFTAADSAPGVVGISQDSAVVFTACRDGTVHMWSAVGGDVLQTFRAPCEPSVLCLAVTPDLQFVIIA